MSAYDFRAIVAEVNSRAKDHPIGRLQEIRKRLKGLSRLPGRDVFAKATTFDEYAYHWGGQPELQFNIGIEHVDDGDLLRSGVAFSIQTNRSMPDVSTLFPKVQLFNDYISLHPEVCADMKMWHWSRKAGRSPLYTPSVIPAEHCVEGFFIFLGKLQRFPNIDFEAILNDFDRLLPLYKYVESGG
jgi:hypothetical protein